MQIFETCVQEFEYQYEVKICILCINRGTLITKIKFATTSIRFLSVDEDDIREIVSLEFLALLQDVLNHDLLIQDYFEQVFDTSSNMSALFDHFAMLMSQDDLIVIELFLKH